MNWLPAVVGQLQTFGNRFVQYMKILIKLLFSTLLILIFTVAKASSPPPELVISWFTALENACSMADPLHSGLYKKGMLDIMDEDAKVSFQVTHDENFPSLVESMAGEVAKLNRDEFLRECASLLVRRVY